MSLLFLCSLAGSEFFFYEIGFKKFHGLQKTCRAESFSWYNFCNGITSSNLAKLKNPQVCLKKNDVISDVFLLFLSKNLKTHFSPILSRYFRISQNLSFKLLFCPLSRVKFPNQPDYSGKPTKNTLYYLLPPLGLAFS